MRRLGVKLPPYVARADEARREVAKLVERLVARGCDLDQLAQILEAAVARLISSRKR